MKEKIKAYLQGPRPYQQGVDLFRQYGNNLMLKATFRRVPESETLRQTLYEELRKLAGLTEEEFRSMKRFAVAPKGEKTSSESVVEPVKVKLKIDVKPEPVGSPVVQKVIRFRERFPFLNDADCPDVLKILVADMFTAYDTYVKTYNAIVDAPEDASNEEILLMAATTVENYLEDRAIFMELEHYRDNKELLGAHPRVFAAIMAEDLSSKSDIELMKMARNSSTNVSKWKAKVANATDEKEKQNAEKQLERWEKTKSVVKAELDKRKKN